MHRHTDGFDVVHEEYNIDRKNVARVLYVELIMCIEFINRMEKIRNMILRLAEIRPPKKIFGVRKLMVFEKCEGNPR